MFDLDTFLPFVIGFLVVAGIAIGMSTATLVTLVQERRGTGRVVPMSAAHPAVAAFADRAA